MSADLGRPPPTTDASGEYTHAQILTILSGLLLGMFLGALDQSIVSTAIRTIADDLNGLSIQAWVTTAYLITSTITTPIYGKLGDLYGRKKLFLFAITVFIIGLGRVLVRRRRCTCWRRSAPCRASAPAACSRWCSRSSATSCRRASAPSYTGYFMAVFAHLERARPGRSAASSPATTTILGHRPAGAGCSWSTCRSASPPCSWSTAPCTSTTCRREARIDWWGAATLVVALVPLLTVAEQGRDVGLGLRPRRWPATPSAALGLARVRRRRAPDGRRRADPAADLPDPRGRRSRSCASVIVGAAMFGGDHGAAALHADRARRLADRGRPPDAADGGRHDERLASASGQVISRTGRIRIVPDHRLRAGRRSRCSLLSLVTADTSLLLGDGR